MVPVADIGLVVLIYAMTTLLFAVTNTKRNKRRKMCIFMLVSITSVQN